MKKIKQWRTASLQLSNTTTSTFDLSHTLVKNDYFSDINPRSMRRLLNIVAVTGKHLVSPVEGIDILIEQHIFSYEM